MDMCYKTSESKDFNSTSKTSTVSYLKVLKVSIWRMPRKWNIVKGGCFYNIEMIGHLFMPWLNLKTMNVKELGIVVVSSAEATQSKK